MKSQMTGQERILAVLNHQVPDRVPTFEWEIDEGVLKAMIGKTSVEDFAEEMDLDAIVTRADYRKTPVADKVVRDEWGVTSQKTHTAHNATLHQYAPIKTMEDLEKMVIPDADAPNRFDTFKQLVKRFKGRKAIIIQTRDVFAHPRDLLGYEQFLVDCLERPELIKAIIEKTLPHSIRIVQQAAELGADVVMTGDDIADTRSTLVSPKVWERLFMPYFRQFVQAIHDSGLKYWKHTDGNILKVLDGMVDAGIDGIDPVDPMAGMSLADFKTRYGSRVAIKGNVDCAYALVTGTEEEVVRMTRQCLAVGGPGGGYCCSSSNTIHDGVRPELYYAMLKTIHEEGVYPLDLDRLNQ